MTQGNLSPAEKAMAAIKQRTKDASKADKHKNKPAAGYQLGHLKKTMLDHTSDQSPS